MKAKNFLRTIISFASMAGFISGWALLANTPDANTSETASSPASITLEMQPVPNINDMVGGGSSSQIGSVQTFSLKMSASSTMPRMRSGGS